MTPVEVLTVALALLVGAIFGAIAVIVILERVGARDRRRALEDVARRGEVIYFPGKRRVG